MSKELNFDATLELEIEEPTPVTTTRTAWNAPAIPEGRLELIFPPGQTPVRYAESRPARRLAPQRRTQAPAKKDGVLFWIRAIARMSLE